MKRRCLDCGESIYGRVDKKFCSDLCRNNYHNKEQRDENNYIRNVNAVLRRNRKILSELNPNGKMKIHRKKMTNKGFNFNFFTNVYKTKAGKIYYFCYDMGYLPLEGDYFALVKRREEIAM